MNGNARKVYNFQALCSLYLHFLLFVIGCLSSLNSDNLLTRSLQRVLRNIDYNKVRTSENSYSQSSCGLMGDQNYASIRKVFCCVLFFLQNIFKPLISIYAEE